MAASEHSERAEVLTSALAGHFFSADTALQEYAEQSIRTALEDGDDTCELAAALSPFLSPPHDAPALAEALQQLWSAAADPGMPEVQLHKWAWVRHHEQEEIQQQGRQQQQQQQQQQQASGAVAAPPSSRELSVGAAEFRPSCAASAAAAQAAEELAGLAMDDAGACDWWVGGYEHAAEAAAKSAAWQQQDRAYSANDGADWRAAAEEQPLTWWDAAGAGGDAGGSNGGPLADTASADAFLQLLVEQFPFYSREALCQLFEQQGRDPDATVEALFSLEAELAGPALPPAAARVQQPLQQLREPAFGEQDFPSLCSSSSGGGGSSRTAATTAAAAGSSTRGWVQVATSAATLPPPAPSAWGTSIASSSSGGGRGRSAAESSPAPIWQARGVQKFKTGGALAEEYASLRAAARDHARARNMYFQQATQAYLVGQRALAKELGAKGRWHNERMKEAHEAASGQLFARRNAETLGSGGRSPGGGASGVTTVDLHGLHVSEAIERIDELVGEARRRGGRRLRLVVGRGQHTKGAPAARLPAAVRRRLEELGLAVSERYAGLLEVML